jgi:hypothetical protein
MALVPPVHSLLRAVVCRAGNNYRMGDEMKDGGQAFPELNMLTDRGRPNGLFLHAEYKASGLTKRELFAAMAMQGYVASGNKNEEWTAIASVKQADALIAELEKE